MFKKTVQGLLLLAFAICAILPFPQASEAAAVKIMPLGDSITGSPGCWRALLWNQLVNSGYANIDFVGTLPLQGCGVSHDGDNEGHGGILATNMASQSLLPDWLSATNPDIVMMHLGTNDVWSAKPIDTILAAFSTLVDQMRANNPNMKILVAQILPVNPSSCSQCAQRTIDFNSAIPAWASAKSTSQSPIVVVDQWTDFNDATDTSDGVHPNSDGNKKIADKWYPALVDLLNGAIVPDFGVTAAPTAYLADKGSSTTGTITVGRGGGFSGTVALTASGLPSGVTATFSPSTISGAGISTMTLSASSEATSGTVMVTISGTSGSLVRSASIKLIVRGEGDLGAVPCENAVTFTKGISGLGTTGAACYRTAESFNGWGCYNMEGRTLSVNNVPVTCGKLPLPEKWPDGYYYFSFTSGTYPWAGLYAW